MSFHVVVITQEITKAAQLVRAGQALPPDEGAPIAVSGFVPDDLENPDRSVRDAVADADVVLISHVLSDDAARRLEIILESARDEAAVIVLSSLRSLLGRTRLGRLRFGDLVRSVGRAGPLPDEVRELFTAADMTAAIRNFRARLPEILKRLPAELADLRAYLHVAAAWMEPTPRHFADLLLMLRSRYGRDPVVAGGTSWEAPVFLPQEGFWSRAKGIEAAPTSRTDGDERPAVLLLVPRAAILAEDTDAVEVVERELERQAIRCVVAFADSFDHGPIVERFAKVEKPAAVINLTGFPFAGGHNRCEPSRAAAIFGGLGIPYLAPPVLLMQDATSWRRSQLGLLPMEIALQTAMHELEGAIEPLVVAGATHSDSSARRTTIDDRATRLAGRTRRWIDLGTKDVSTKKVALVVFAFPPGKGSVGTAAYLDVFRSTFNLLSRLKAAGYRVEMPDSPQALLELVIHGQDKAAAQHDVELAVAARLDVATYERNAPASRRIERQWGRAPGDLSSDGRDLLIHGVALGNVFVGVQPSFGFEGDPMRLLFSRSATPHHGFMAFYAWISKVFGADAVVHVGTHGALEFMPGKQAGLSGECWPDVLIDDLPNVYLYAVNNPSEGTIAKRRGQALTVTHLVPPLDRAGLERHLATLRDLVDEFRDAASDEERKRIVESAIEVVAVANLDADVAPPSAASPGAALDFIGRLYVALIDIEQRRIPVGLHVAGEAVDIEASIELMAAIGEHGPAEDGESGFAAAWRSDRRLDRDEFERSLRQGAPDVVASFTEARSGWRDVVTTLLRDDLEGARTAIVNLLPSTAPDQREALLNFVVERRRLAASGDELGAILDALAGRYILPGAGGDPVRVPDVLPTGRNLHGLDPARVPSLGARRRAREMTDALLERRHAELGGWPETIGLVLWGLDNVKSRGEGIAQALWLLGVEPETNSIGRIAKVRVVPIDELGRPRIDVVCMASGIFRDIFGLHLALLDEAVRLVASLDEPDDINYVRKHVRELGMREGISPSAATHRVFSNAPGNYGANVDHMVALGKWEERSDLARLFLNRKGFAFGRGTDGVDAAEILGALAEGIDTTFQNIDSSEVSLTDVDHYFEYLGGLSALVEDRRGERPRVLVGDATGPITKVRDLDAAVRLEVRTKLLNSKWYEGMLRHGYEGAEEIRKRLDYTFGWSATVDAVAPWIYREVMRTYVDDDATRDRLRDANLHSFQAMVKRLKEAAGRGFWQPTADESRRLDDVDANLEDAIEGAG